jgi:hypothetical protein
MTMKSSRHEREGEKSEKKNGNISGHETEALAVTYQAGLERLSFNTLRLRRGIRQLRGA